MDACGGGCPAEIAHFRFDDNQKQTLWSNSRCANSARSQRPGRDVDTAGRWRWLRIRQGKEEAHRQLTTCSIGNNACFWPTHSTRHGEDRGRRWPTSRSALSSLLRGCSSKQFEGEFWPAQWLGDVQAVGVSVLPFPVESASEDHLGGNANLGWRVAEPHLESGPRANEDRQLLPSTPIHFYE